MGFGVCQKCGGYWCTVGEYVNYCICKEETTMAKFAAIGTDGMRPVVWRLGDTEEAALVDAGLQPDVDGVDLHTEPVSDVQAEKIEQGVVDWKTVCSYTNMSRDELAAAAKINNDLVAGLPVQESLDPGNPVLQAADAFNRSQKK